MLTKFEEKAYGLIIFLMFMALLTVFIPAKPFAQSLPPSEMYGKLDVKAINAGVMKIQGSVECRKYFDECVMKEHWFGGILKSRDTVNVSQMVIIRTGVTNPEIMRVEDNGNKKLVIYFSYDGGRHEHWLPIDED